MTGKLRTVMTTTREFNSWQEFQEYCHSMSEQGVFTKKFWSDMIKFNRAEFSTPEPINQTTVTTTGRVTHSERFK